MISVSGVPGIEITPSTHRLTTPREAWYKAIPSLHVLCWGTCLAVFLNAQCPFRSFKVLLILLAASIYQFPGKDAVANILEYLSAKFKKPSSNVPILKIEDHKEATLWAGLALFPWRTMLMEQPCCGGRSSASFRHLFPTWHLDIPQPWAEHGFPIRASSLVIAQL